MASVKSLLSSLFRRRSDTPEPAPSSETKALLADYYAGLVRAGHRVDGQQWTVERAVAQGYERVIWVFRAVNLISGHAARKDVPFRFRDTRKDSDQVVDDHPLYRLLNNKANPMESGQVFRKRLSAQLLLSPRGAFVEETQSRAGTPVRLDLLPPGRTRIVPGSGDDLISHFEVTRTDGSRYTIDPERVRWFRDPHPTDPYGAVTPLTSAGMSIELDYFARLYNTSFMRNDGRPGGVLAIDGDMEEDSMLILRNRFTGPPGPADAGRVSVIAGKVSYADIAARPRDMAYQTTTRTAKMEVLEAFGVPESQIGNAADRTYANAEAEEFAVWAHVEVPHLDLIAAGFDDNEDDSIEPFFDLSAIGVLELPARARREEARLEVAAGVRSIKSYADLAGYGEQVDDTPQTRALWLPSGKTPLPSREADAAALGFDTGATTTDTSAAPAAGDAAAGADTTTGGDAAAPPTDTQPTPVPTEPTPPGPDTGATPAAAAGDQAGTVSRLPADQRGTAAPAAGEAKAAPRGRQPAARVIPIRRPTAGEWRDLDPTDTATPATQALTDALTGLLPRWRDRTATRLRSPRTRKGTRHWTPEYAVDTRIGTKALDTGYAADEETVAADTDTTARALLEATALAAAAAWLTAATGTPIPPAAITAAIAARAAGRNPAPAGGLPGAVLADIGQQAVESALAALPPLVTSAVREVRRSAEAAAAVDAAGGTVDDVVNAVTGRDATMRAWAAAAAENAATAATEAAHHAAAEGWAEATGQDINRQWFTRLDDRVRDDHAAAHGQTRDLAEPFTVGGTQLRYPRDPLGPPGQTINCRCRAQHRVRSTGLFTAPPAAEPVAAEAS